MDPVNVALWLCVISLLIRRYFKNGCNCWKEFDVPHDLPVVFFGNVMNYVLRRKTKGEVTRELYNKFYGERFIGFYEVKRNGVIVTQPEDVKRVLVTNFEHFQDRTDFDFGKRETLYHNLITAKSKKWKTIRQKVSPAFSVDSLKNMVPLVVEVSENFSEYLFKVVDREIEFKELMSKFTADVIGSCGYGLRINSIEDENSSFRNMGGKLLDFGPIVMFKVILKQVAPYLFELLKVRFQNEDEEQFFTNVIKDVAEEKNLTGKKRNDFVDLLLEMQGGESDDKFISEQAFLFMFGGFETTSTLMSFTLHELALNAEIQDKVYGEIVSVLKKCNQKLTYEIVSEMHYMDMVISEVQRMYPALENLERICTSPYTFPDSNITLDVGNSITIPVTAIHFDSKYYTDPEKFDPERFNEEAKKTIDPMAYLPFGEGPRQCLGE